MRNKRRQERTEQKLNYRLWRIRKDQNKYRMFHFIESMKLAGFNATPVEAWFAPTGTPFPEVNSPGGFEWQKIS